MNIPVVTNEFEKFEFKNYDSSKGVNRVILPDGTYQEYDSQSPDGYIVTIQPNNSCFMIIKKFYKDGNIMEKGLMINSGDSKKGNWYYFDKQGRLLREEDNDLPFKFTFEDLFNFLKKEKIPLAVGRIQGGFHTQINNNPDPKETWWEVRWLKDKSRMPNVIEEIRINGISGKVISRKQSGYYNN